MRSWQRTAGGDMWNRPAATPRGGHMWTRIQVLPAVLVRLGSDRPRYPCNIWASRGLKRIGEMGCL